MRKVRTLKIGKLNLSEQRDIYAKRLDKLIASDLDFGMTARQRMRQELLLRLKIADIERRLNRQARLRYNKED